ncbi:MAG: SpoIIE family protein phosphatase [Calditrichia bacterium]|nr:SpoIIE family protein phosphatase [Calditrichia bacterium]
MAQIKINSIEQPFNYEETEFNIYLNNIIHEWLKTLTTLAYILIPLFFFLDYFTMPEELLPRFIIYRFLSTVIVIIQYLIIRNTKPGIYSYVHGYFIALNVGGTIALMTVDLGGFNSSYYAGLNLVIIGVILLIPWKVVHSTINSLMIVSLYMVFNIIYAREYETSILINNLFFLCSTAVMAVSINYVKHKQVKKEFMLLVELRKARDAIWSEMELAKRIQTALLPDEEKISGLEIAAKMLPAKAVGGDYYDIIETKSGNKWITIGDVSGHGVDSGLIMMMAQTSILSMVTNSPDKKPSDILTSINTVLIENISRLNSDHYMTMMALKFNDSNVTVAGKHQDIIIYRQNSNTTETITTKGTWLGISDKISHFQKDYNFVIDSGDIILLFTDGITEATNRKGEMYGQTRLEQALDQFADLPINKILEKIIDEVNFFQDEQLDDMSLVIVKKLQT